MDVEFNSLKGFFLYTIGLFLIGILFGRYGLDKAIELAQWLISLLMGIGA